MTISSKYPSIKPSLLLDFANTKSIDPRIIFSRASTATYFDNTGLMKTAAANVGRINHDPVTGACKGLLIEEQRTNLLTYSEQFDNAAWTKFAVTVAANSVVAPDGTMSADKLVENTANNSHSASVTISTLSSGTPYSFSLYAKASEAGRYLAVALGGTAFTSVQTIGFTLSGNGSFAVLGGSAATPTIQNIGNGWYRCSVTSTAQANGTGLVVYYLSTSGTSGAGLTYTGDGTSGLYIWGAQLEVGAFPTSYIPTTSAQVTRAADVATMTGTNFSNWYRQDEGTLFGEFEVPTNRSYSGTFRTVAQISPSGSSITYVQLFVNNASQFSFYVQDGATVQANISNGSNTGTISKLAGCYRVNDFALSANGAASMTDTSGQAPITLPPTQMTIGGVRDGNVLGNINGHIRRIAYYPKRLSNTELQALTS